MATYAVNGDTLTGIADAIRAKTGSDEQMPIAAMAAAIEGIPTGGGIKVATGYVDVPAAMYAYVFTHNIGKIPKIFVLSIDADAAAPSGYYVSGAVWIRDGASVMLRGYTDNFYNSAQNIRASIIAHDGKEASGGCGCDDACFYINGTSKTAVARYYWTAYYED